MGSHLHQISEILEVPHLKFSSLVACHRMSGTFHWLCPELQIESWICYIFNIIPPFVDSRLRKFLLGFSSSRRVKFSLNLSSFSRNSCSIWTSVSSIVWILTDESAESQLISLVSSSSSSLLIFLEFFLRDLSKIRVTSLR